jgi:hypothetical protein
MLLSTEYPGSNDEAIYLTSQESRKYRFIDEQMPKQKLIHLPGSEEWHERDFRAFIEL